MERRILVTGAQGQLGTELCRQLGPGTIGLDLPDLDITDCDAVVATVERCRPEIVINAAAFTHVDRAELEPEACRAVNLSGVENLVAACRARGSSIVQISTDYVFGGQKTVPYLETDLPNPLNVYGQAKWEAEQVVAQYPHHLIVRTAGLFGAGGSAASGNFVDTMLRLARSNRPLRVVDDQFTSLTFTADLASGIRTLLAAQLNGLFHLTNAGHASWYQVALEVFRIANLKPQIEPVPMADYPCAARRPRFSVLSSAKYNATPRPHPLPTWQQAVARYLTLRRDVSSW